MAQTINADDGVISGSAGLKWASDGTAILSLQTKGTTALTVDGSQNVGIGTSSPGYKLDVRGVTASGNGTITTGFTYDTRGLVGTFSNHALGFITNGTSPTMVLDTSGNLGVGNTSPAYRLHLSSAIDTYAFCVRDTIGNDRLLIGSRASAPIDNITPVQIANDNDGNLLLSSRTNNASGIKFYSNAGTAAVERARIQSGGTFLVSADGVGSVSFAAFNKAGVSDSITTNLFTVTASNNAITGLLEINYAISDPGIETYAGRKVYRLFWNGISALLNAITTEAYGGVEPTFSITASGATATIRVDFNSGAATYDITVAVSFTPVSTTSSVIAINEA